MRGERSGPSNCRPLTPSPVAQVGRIGGDVRTILELLQLQQKAVAVPAAVPAAVSVAAATAVAALPAAPAAAAPAARPALAVRGQRVEALSLAAAMAAPAATERLV